MLDPSLSRHANSQPAYTPIDGSRPLARRWRRRRPPRRTHPDQSPGSLLEIRHAPSHCLTHCSAKLK